jgi:hypothetical protein
MYENHHLQNYEMKVSLDFILKTKIQFIIESSYNFVVGFYIKRS